MQVSLPHFQSLQLPACESGDGASYQSEHEKVYCIQGMGGAAHLSNINYMTIYEQLYLLLSLSFP